MHPNTRGLALLLSLGSLPVACTKSDGDDDTSGDTTSPGTAPTTGDATDSSTSPTTAPAATTGSTGGTETGGTDETAATTAPTTEPGTGSTGGPATDPTCLAYAAKLVECMPRYARYQQQYAQQCEMYKQYGFRTDGQMCLDALEALYVCLSMAECSERGACAAENMAIGGGACPSFGG